MSGSDEDKRAVIDEALAAIRTFNLVREMALESHDQAMDELGQLVAVSHMAQGQAGVPPADHRDTLIRELMSRVEVLSKAVVDLERAATGKSLALQMLDDAQEKLVLEDQARAQRQHSMAMDVVRKEAEEAKSEVQSFRTRENAETLGVEAMSAFEKLMAQAGVITKSKQTPTVLDFLEGHYLQARNLDETHQRHVEAYVRLFAKATDNKPVGSYTRKDILGWVRVIERIPTGYGKGGKDKHKTIQQILREARAKKAETISVTTVGKHIAALKRFFREANSTHEFSNADRVAAMFENIELSSHVPEAQKRRPWRIEELHALFRTPIWSGTRSRFEDRRTRHEVGRWVHLDAYWWLPVLGIHTGARLEELAQLHHEDLKVSGDGIKFLHINDQGNRRVKTKSSIRAIPLHPFLLELGFDRMFKPGQRGRVFHELSKGANGKWGEDFSEDFTAYRRHCGLYAPLLDFHAFRHSFVSYMRGKAKVDAGLVAAMVGHGADEDPTLAQFIQTGQYTDFDIADRYEAICKLDYHQMGVGLAHIRNAVTQVKGGRGSFRLPDAPLPEDQE